MRSVWAEGGSNEAEDLTIDGAILTLLLLGMLALGLLHLFVETVLWALPLLMLTELGKGLFRFILGTSTEPCGGGAIPIPSR